MKFEIKTFLFSVLLIFSAMAAGEPAREQEDSGIVSEETWGNMKRIANFSPYSAAGCAAYYAMPPGFGNIRTKRGATPYGDAKAICGFFGFLSVVFNHLPLFTSSPDIQDVAFFSENPLMYLWKQTAWLDTAGTVSYGLSFTTNINYRTDARNFFLLKRAIDTAVIIPFFVFRMLPDL